MSKALIIVDMQYDFVYGSLPVPNAKDIIPIIYWIAENVSYECVTLTLDWHPEHHVSFKQWPIHCVEYSLGATCVLDGHLFIKCMSPICFPIYKGINIEIDSYSGFFDNDHKTKTDLQKNLNTFPNKIDELDIVGLATDYCVKFTAMDAVKLGYKTNVLSFACRGVTPETTNAAIKEMVDGGVKIT